MIRIRSRGSALHFAGPATAAILIGTLATCWLWGRVGDACDLITRSRFRRHVERTEGILRETIGSYELALNAAAGPFQASGEASQDDWTAYVRTLRLRETLPDLVTVKLIESRDEALSTLNDPGMDPALREALLHSRNEGRPHLTRRLGRGFVPAAPDRQIALCMALPEPAVSVGGATSPRHGWIVAYIEVDSLFERVRLAELPEARLEVYDGLQRSPDALLHDSRDSARAAAVASDVAWQIVESQEIAGRLWNLRFRVPLSYGGPLEPLAKLFTLLMGIFGTLLSSALVSYVSGSRAKSEKERAAREEGSAESRSTGSLGAASSNRSASIRGNARVLDGGPGAAWNPPAPGALPNTIAAGSPLPWERGASAPKATGAAASRSAVTQGSASDQLRSAGAGAADAGLAGGTGGGTGGTTGDATGGGTGQRPRGIQEKNASGDRSSGCGTSGQGETPRAVDASRPGDGAADSRDVPEREAAARPRPTQVSPTPPGRARHFREDSLPARILRQDPEREAAAEMPEPPEEPAAPARNEVDLNGMLVLVVEDSFVNRKVVSRVLERQGCIVKVVSNGREAVEELGENQYQLILMDLQMPILDGAQATREIRTLEAVSGRRVPIVALSAHSGKAEREHCLGAGMDDFLTKPLEVEALMSSLKNIAQRQRNVPRRAA